MMGVKGTPCPKESISWSFFFFCNEPLGNKDQISQESVRERLIRSFCTFVDSINILYTSISRKVQTLSKML